MTLKEAEKRIRELEKLVQDLKVTQVEHHHYHSPMPPLWPHYVQPQWIPQQPFRPYDVLCGYSTTVAHDGARASLSAMS